MSRKARSSASKVPGLGEAQGQPPDGAALHRERQRDHRFVAHRGVEVVQVRIRRPHLRGVVEPQRPLPQAVGRRQVRVRGVRGERLRDLIGVADQAERHQLRAGAVEQRDRSGVRAGRLLPQREDDVGDPLRGGRGRQGRGHLLQPPRPALGGGDHALLALHPATEHDRAGDAEGHQEPQRGELHPQGAARVRIGGGGGPVDEHGPAGHVAVGRVRREAVGLAEHVARARLDAGGRRLRGPAPRPLEGRSAPHVPRAHEARGDEQHPPPVDDQGVAAAQLLPHLREAVEPGDAQRPDQGAVDPPVIAARGRDHHHHGRRVDRRGDGGAQARLPPVARLRQHRAQVAGRDVAREQAGAVLGADATVAVEPRDAPHESELGRVQAAQPARDARLVGREEGVRGREGLQDLGARPDELGDVVDARRRRRRDPPGLGVGGVVVAAQREGRPGRPEGEGDRHRRHHQAADPASTPARHRHLPSPVAGPEFSLPVATLPPPSQARHAVPEEGRLTRDVQRFARGGGGYRRLVSASRQVRSTGDHDGVVKHFTWSACGRRRIHDTPTSARSPRACPGCGPSSRPPAPRSCSASARPRHAPCWARTSA